MIRHMVVFRFKPSAPAEKVAAILADYEEFPSTHRGMRNFTIGRNISERDQTFEWGFSVDFDGEDELKAYLNSPAHEEHVVERFRPIVEARAIVSYVVEAPAVAG